MSREAIREFQHDRARPRAAEALVMLQKIASLVKPIMRQRGWTVGVLSEFWPDEQQLLGLNVNRGHRICLRLRYAVDERQFLPLLEVTDTMLHELCHNVYGPHDEPFHNLWNQLRDEHEALTRKGYTGEGFLSAGRALGGGRIPRHELQRRARAAVMSSAVGAPQGRRLGGSSIRRGDDVRKIIADAATRRMRITRGCGEGSQHQDQLVANSNQNSVRTKALPADENEEAIMIAYIDLVHEEEQEKYGDSYRPSSQRNPAGTRGCAAGKIKAENDLQSSQLVDLTDLEDSSWTCRICTLFNPPAYLFCDACDVERPSPPATPSAIKMQSATRSIESNATRAVRKLQELEQTQRMRPAKPLAWACRRCGQYTEQEWWTCVNCGSMKETS